MTAEKAIEIAESCGAFQAPFFGTVTLDVRNGSVKEVAVLQTFRETIEN